MQDVKVQIVPKTISIFWRLPLLFYYVEQTTPKRIAKYKILAHNTMKWTRWLGHWSRPNSSQILKPEPELRNKSTYVINGVMLEKHSVSFTMSFTAQRVNAPPVTDDI